MGYYVGDRPDTSLVVVPSSIDVEDFNTADVTLLDPARQPVDAPGLAATVSTIDGIQVVWPTAADVLTEPGVYWLAVTLSQVEEGVVIGRRRLPLAPIVVQDEDGWYTIDDARNDWDGAPVDDHRLYELLATARHHVLEYAPTLAEGAPVPVNWRAAQLMQARNIWNAYRTDPNGSAYGGPDEFRVTVFPLDWQVKQMIRPTRAVPAVG